MSSLVHVAGDLHKTISFVVGVLSTSFARALLIQAHPLEHELPYAIKYFQKYNSYKD